MFLWVIIKGIVCPKPQQNFINNLFITSDMIIVIGGRAGSGKSTIAKLVAKKLKLKHYSIGDLQRQIAKERGISLLELGRLEEKDPTIDRDLDNKQKELGKNEDNFVIDGRLSAFFMPKAIKIFLDADEKARAERILKDNRETEKNSDLKEAIKNMKKREDSENKRYKEYYGIGCYDKSKYDFVIDTTDLTVEQVADKVIEAVKE